jgi:hypothetical protein
MNMHAAELAFVEALHEATSRNLVTWTFIADDDREVYRATVDGAVVEIEFLRFQTAVGGTFERVLAMVSGLKTYFAVAAGTSAYQTLQSMVAPQQSWTSAVKKLGKATERIRSLLAEKQ